MRQHLRRRSSGGNLFGWCDLPQYRAVRQQEGKWLYKWHQRNGGAFARSCTGFIWVPDWLRKMVNCVANSSRANVPSFQKNYWSVSPWMTQSLQWDHPFPLSPSPTHIARISTGLSSCRGCTETVGDLCLAGSFGFGAGDGSSWRTGKGGCKTNLTKSLGAKYRRTKCGKATVQPKPEPKLVRNPDLKPKLIDPNFLTQDYLPTPMFDVLALRQCCLSFGTFEGRIPHHPHGFSFFTGTSSSSFSSSFSRPAAK